MKETIIFVLNVISSIIIGLQGIVWFYRNFFTSRPVYTVKTTKMFDFNVSDKENSVITYNGEEIKNLYKTQILFYNAGIRGMKSHELILKYGDMVKFLDIDFACTKSVLNIGLFPDQNNRNITIKHGNILHKEGFCFNLTHTSSVEISTDAFELISDNLKYKPRKMKNQVDFELAIPEATKKSKKSLQSYLGCMVVGIVLTLLSWLVPSIQVYALFTILGILLFLFIAFLLFSLVAFSKEVRNVFKCNLLVEIAKIYNSQKMNRISLDKPFVKYLTQIQK